jgi:hypothetical protein
MVRTVHCLTLAAAVVAVTSTSVTQASIKNVDPSSYGVCNEQASSCRLTFVNNECIGEKRVVCGRWLPSQDCKTSFHLGFPDVCAVENNVAVETTFSWKAGWFKRFCQVVDPGVPAVFSVRDVADCTGSALVSFHYTGGRLATVARCAPAEIETSNLQLYEHSWFEKYADLWAESMAWPPSTPDDEGKISYFKADDPTYRPRVPKACIWEVSWLKCPPKEPVFCCEAETASCKACKTGWSVEDYCVGYPDTPGCPEMCCMADEATCNACQAQEDVEDYCTLNTHVDGCCDLFPDMFGCEH